MEVELNHHQSLGMDEYTGVKQCTFHWLISSELEQKQWTLISLLIRQLFMITCISYENIFAISLPKYINIAPL